MEQEKPTTPVFSIADEIQRRQKEADERRATWEQKRQRATDLYRDGQNPILAFIDTMKPQQDTDRIKRAERRQRSRRGRISYQRWVRVLSAWPPRATFPRPALMLR